MEYSKSLSGPPGQYTHMFPVVAICGHRCGLDITATTAIPLAVRMGLAFIMGNKRDLYFSGIADIISINLGIWARAYFEHMLFRICLMSIFCLLSTRFISSYEISVRAFTIRSDSSFFRINMDYLK